MSNLTQSHWLRGLLFELCRSFACASIPAMQITVDLTKEKDREKASLLIDSYNKKSKVCGLSIWDSGLMTRTIGALIVHEDIQTVEELNGLPEKYLELLIGIARYGRRDILKLRASSKD